MDSRDIRGQAAAHPVDAPSAGVDRDGPAGVRAADPSSGRDSGVLPRCAPAPWLTAIQRTILVAIERYIDGHGGPPTIDVLRDALRTDGLVLSSRATLHDHLQRIIAKGYLDRDDEHRLVVLISSSQARVGGPGLARTKPTAEELERVLERARESTRATLLEIDGALARFRREVG